MGEQDGVLVARVRRGRPDAPLFAVWPVVVVEELLGAAAAWWAWTRFGLRDAARRRELFRNGP